MRRSFVMVGLALLVGVATAQAQTPATAEAQAAPAQAAAADPLKFTTDDAAVIFQVAAGKGADFEAGMGQMMAALAGSEKAELKAFAGTMKLFKVASTPADQPSLYVLMVSGASKELSYNYGKIIYYSGAEPGAAYAGIYEKQDDATAVYTKIKDAVMPNGINPWPLAKIGG